MVLIEIAVGLLLLFFGRSLFWAFVAFVGFLLGVHLSQVVLVSQPQWVGILVAVALGIVGALVAMLAERVAFALGGLAAGGYLALAAARALHLGGSQILWFAIGGAIGAIVAIGIMDWAIIGLASLVGAATVVEPLDLTPWIAVVVYVVLLVAGLLFQTWRLERPAPRPRAPG